MKFSWCSTENRHSKCPAEYEKFYIDPRTNKAVMTNEIVECECKCHE